MTSSFCFCSKIGKNYFGGHCNLFCCWHFVLASSSGYQEGSPQCSCSLDSTLCHFEAVLFWDSHKVGHCGLVLLHLFFYDI